MSKTAADLWSTLTTDERQIVLDVMAQHPRLTLAAAIAALRAAGM
jgi:hypothetical protein